MPKLIDAADMIAGNNQGFRFSAIRPEKLGCCEYTLATIAIDTTGSLQGFETLIAQCAAQAVECCKKSPRSENLLVRLLTFNTQVDEVHGFLPLEAVPPLPASFPCSGGTALFDAIFASCSAANDYAKHLDDFDFQCNAIAFVITDGCDNASRLSAAIAKEEIERGLKAEFLQSSATVLIGVNAGACSPSLSQIRSQLGITQYIDAGGADASNLAKLANFVSRSICVQSQCLAQGSGTPDLSF